MTHNPETVEQIDGVAFMWSDVCLIVKSTGRGSPRGSLIYIRGISTPFLLDYEHNSIVAKWENHNRALSEGAQ